MKAYPFSIGSCKGDCGQNAANCKTRPLCQIALHRVTVDDVTSAEYDDEVSIYGKATAWAAVGLVALAAVCAAVALTVGTYVADQWPRMVALLSN